MKRLITYSDESKAALDDPVEITIDRTGYNIQMGNHLHVCPAKFDLGVDELEKFVKGINWVKASLPFTMPGIEMIKE
jgi:hypothetical protein